jgi:microsomal dipeptidase-like Zn-dependent dipeptidase
MSTAPRFGARIAPRTGIALAATLPMAMVLGCGGDVAGPSESELASQTAPLPTINGGVLGDSLLPGGPRLPPIDPDILRDALDRPPGVAITSSLPGRLDLFARNADGALLRKHAEGSGETAWESLGGDLTGDPAAISIASGRIDVFARGRRGELAQISFAGGVWGEWVSLGGAIVGAPAVVSPSSGRIEIYARDARDRLVRRVFAGGRWLAWEDLGLPITSDPSAVSPAAGRVELFARDGSSRALLHRTFAASVTGGFTALGGDLTSAPSATIAGGVIEVFARGPRGVLLRRRLVSGSWQPWQDLGGRIESAPAAFGNGARIDIAARGGEDRLIRRAIDGAATSEPRTGAPVRYEPAWGVADLHAHPATHLSFGASASGGGLLWGHPGLAWDPTGASVTRDLPPCPADKHAGYTSDLVNHVTRVRVLSTADQISGHPHVGGADGAYTNWPHALSLSHQQMHVDFVRRAFEGGVRLVFASVTNNQTIAMLWHRGSTAGSVSLPTPSETDDYESARTQLRFIRQLAAANPGWMQVVTTPREARDAIARGRLALVLALELDKLTADQILALQREFGVASVIPVHLADNEFGGAAIYSDVFNTNNWYLNREFHAVRGNPNLRFRLGRPQYLHMHEWDLFQGGAVEPRHISREAHCALGYEPCAGFPVGVPHHHGHENARGIDPARVERLMRAGLILDVSHMGTQATAQTLTLAERHGYPLVASHGGVRPDGVRADSERSPLASQAERMSILGGVFGVGTEVLGTPTTVASDVGAPIVRLRGDQRTWSRSLRPEPSLDRPTSGLRVTIRTGEDDLRGGHDNAAGIVRYRVRTASGAIESRVVRVPLNGTARWHGRSTNTVFVSLPDRPLASQIDSFEIQTSFGGGVFGDNWDVADLVVEFEAGAEFHELFRRQGEPFFRFTGERQHFAQGFFREHAWDATIDRLQLTLRTGDDDLRSDTKATAIVTLENGTRLETPINDGRGFGRGAVTTVNLALPAGVRLGEIASVVVRSVSDSHDIAKDNWNVDEATLEYTTTSGARRILERVVGGPYHRFTGAAQSTALYAKRASRPSETADATLVRVTIRTGADDLRAGSRANLVIGLRSSVTSGRVPFNEGGELPNGGTYHKVVRLPPGTRVVDLDWIRIEHDGDGGVSYDNWNIDEVKVEILTDPVADWISHFTTVSNVALGRGVAIGTDLNGFAPQIPYTKRAMPPTITAARDRAPTWARATTPELRPHRLGARRIFDFSRDGIAHYGMLPDFFQAVSATPEGAAAVDTLFRSAEDTIRAWERTLAARARVVGPR